MNECPCCSSKSYNDCCGRFIEKNQVPTTPEELMRSRYTAYTQTNIAYIVETMKSPASDNFDEEGAKDWAKSVKWKGLEVIKTQTKEDKGYVEFIAEFEEKHQPYSMHELSEFIKENGRWFYVDGEDPCDHSHHHVPKQSVGRNEACPCGSGKKYKKCCAN